MMVCQLAMEEATHSIRANAVGPGTIKGGMEMPNSEATAVALVESVTEMTPMKRFRKAAKLSEAVAFLASPKAPYITDQVSMIDSGFAA